MSTHLFKGDINEREPHIGKNEIVESITMLIN
jgi:hypothetical protein